jgi:hypothetical protein
MIKLEREKRKAKVKLKYNKVMAFNHVLTLMGSVTAQQLRYVS